MVRMDSMIGVARIGVSTVNLSFGYSEKQKDSAPDVVQLVKIGLKDGRGEENIMTRSEGKVIFPALIDKGMDGHLEIALKGSRGVIIEEYYEHQIRIGNIQIYKEELEDVITVLKEAKKILEEKQEQNER